MNLITQADIARATGRERSNVRDSYRRGLLPKPDFTINESTPLWKPETIQPYIEKECSK